MSAGSSTRTAIPKGLRALRLELAGARGGALALLTSLDEAAEFAATYLGAEPVPPRGLALFDELRLLAVPEGLVVEGLVGAPWYGRRRELGAALVELVRRVRMAALGEGTERFALHAAAVELPLGDGARGRAVLIVGRPGSGKSTLAARLARDGARWLADDFVVLDRRTGAVLAHPEAPALAPDSAAVLGVDWSAGRGWPASETVRPEKRYFPRLFARSPGAPLGAVVFLVPEEAPLAVSPLERLPASEGAVRLVRALARARLDFESALAGAVELAERCGPVFRVARSQELEATAAAVRALLEINGGDR